jgi:hypothetical protein
MFFEVRIEDSYSRYVLPIRGSGMMFFPEGFLSAGNGFFLCKEGQGSLPMPCYVSMCMYVHKLLQKPRGEW